MQDQNAIPKILVDDENNKKPENEIFENKNNSSVNDKKSRDKMWVFDFREECINNNEILFLRTPIIFKLCSLFNKQNEIKSDPI